jgi:copper chaperone CopZ
MEWSFYCYVATAAYRRVTMPAVTLSVPSIVCEGCVSLIDDQLSRVAGVESVHGDTSTKTVTVHGGADVAALKAAIREVGHTVDD